jgi:multiple sugar transport system ATP-binding protein
MGIKLKLENLTKVFGELVAVNKLDLDILDREFVCFLGPSGCGKTTTLNMLSGLEEPTEGKIILDGKVINHLPARLRDIGLIFQDYAIFENMNVYDNLAFSLKAQKTTKGEIERIVKEQARQFQLTPLLYKDTRTLNPGDLQRVAIGRTVIMAPSVFLLDEPLDNLDADMRITMRGELKRLQKELGKTMVYVTHDQEEAMSLADRIVIMDGGKLQQFDTPMNVYNHPANKFVAGFVGKLPMNFIDCSIKEEYGKLILFNKLQNFQLDISKQRKIVEESISGKELCLGVRPENITVVPTPGPDAFGVMVHNIEELGAENVVEFNFKGESGIVRRIILPPEVLPKLNEAMFLRFQIEKIHLIDPETEKVLI